MQRTIEFARPEVQKFPQFGKVRMQVVTLPDETLQNARMIGHSIENIGGGPNQTFGLAGKIRKKWAPRHWPFPPSRPVQPTLSATPLPPPSFPCACTSGI